MTDLIEHPAPHADDSNEEEYSHAHEVAALADQILEEASLDFGDKVKDEDSFEHAKRYASDIAEAHVKYHRSGGVESARAAVRAAAAGIIAPELPAERDEAKRNAMIDTALTHLPNKAALLEAIPAAERDPNVCVISLDGDNFGPINKKHHNAAGDAAIIALAEAVRRAAADHGSTRVFRGGGDEIYVLGDPAEAEAIIASAKDYLAETISGDDPLPDARGELHPIEWYRELGISGAWGMSLNEADEKMYALKAANKTKEEPQP
jgi:GGDEF domain-containing protein